MNMPRSSTLFRFAALSLGVLLLVSYGGNAKEALPLPTPVVASSTPSLPAAPILANPKTPEPASTPLPLPSATSTPSTPVKGTAKNIIVWVHRYDFEKAVHSLEQNSDLIGEVSPAWYMIGERGSIQKIEGSRVDHPRLLETARRESILVRPLLMNVGPSGPDRDKVRALFKDEALRKRHIEEAVSLVVQNGYHGIDLDYEGFRNPELNDLATLVEEMAAALHLRGKTLAVSVEAGRTDDVLPAWKRIGAAADSVRLMAYGQKPGTPGPFIAEAWIEEQLQRAQKAIPREKLSQGIAVYGLAWKGGETLSYTYEQFMESLRTRRITPSRDSKTRMFSYETGGERGWFETGESILAKMRLGKSHGLERYALWRLGGEDPALWEILRSSK